jgi:hypothetical protein
MCADDYLFSNDDVFKIQGVHEFSLKMSRGEYNIIGRGGANEG